MSTPQPQHAESRETSEGSPSPYRRDNWFGDPDVERPSDSHGHLSDDEYLRDRAAHVAHKVHRQVAEKLCPITRFDPPDRGRLWDVPTPEAKTLLRFLDSGVHIDEFPWPDEIADSDPAALHHENFDVELTDPELFVPLEHEDSTRTVEYAQNRHRSRYNDQQGYVTGPYLGDVPEDVFLSEVEIVLQRAVEDGMIFRDRADELLRDGKRMKQAGHYSDQEALAAIVEDVYSAAE